MKVPLAGVIGHPIGHSRSPRIHKHWLKTHNLRGDYVPLDVAPKDLRQVLDALPKAGFVGVNLTIPHKEEGLRLCDRLSDRATRIGAVNTVTFLETGERYGDNTDGYGFLANLRAGAPDWSPESGPVAVLGAGGAARAVIDALIEAGARDIRVTNRTRPRAEALRADFGARVSVVDWVKAGQLLGEAATVINTTSLGMEGQPPLTLPFRLLRPGTVVTDLVYAPLRTGLLQAAEEAGCITVDGLGMLLHQAVPGFERWFGLRPEVDEATRAAALA